MERFLDELTNLGYLRRGQDKAYQIGNSFLLNWFHDSRETLDWEESSPQQPSDKAAGRFYSQTPLEYSQKLLVAHNRRLQKRKMQQATFGINTPSEILNEIEDIEAESEYLNAQLKQTKAGYKKTVNQPK